MEEDKKVDKIEEKKEVTSEVVKEETSASSDNQKSGKLKFLKIFGLTTLVLVIILGLMLIPIKKRTTLGRFFDVFGAHKLAIITDSFMNHGNKMNNFFAIINLNKEDSYKKVWSSIKEENFKFEAVSVDGNWKAYPGNEEKKDAFNVIGDSKLNISLKDQKLAGDLNLSVNMNGNEMGMGEVDNNEFGLDLNSSVVLDKDNVYFKLKKLKTDIPQTEKYNLDLSFDNWYAEPIGLEDEQKEALNKMASLITELTENKLASVLSDETGEEVFKQTYKDGIYKEINVGGVKNVEFGQGENKVEQKVREISIVINDDFINRKPEEKAKESLDLMSKIYEDKTFQSFVKNDFYDWMSKFSKQADIVDGVENSSFPSKDEFGKDFDDQIDSFKKNKQATLDYYEKMNSDSIEKDSKIEFVDYKIYLKPGTNEAYGLKFKIKLSYSDDLLDEMKQNNEMMYELYKDGFFFEGEVYNMKLNDKTSAIVSPKETKSADEFLEEISKNEKASNLINFFGSEFMRTIPGMETKYNGIGDGSIIYQDKNTGGFVYYDAVKQKHYKIVSSNQQTGEVYYLNDNNQYGVVPASIVESFTASMTTSSNQAQKSSISKEEQEQIDKMMME